MCAVCYGQCVASGQCWSNKDCPKSQFCKLDGGDCGKTQQGTCTDVPAICPDGGYNPTCGCDGKTYMSVCDAHLLKVSVASTGPCNEKQCITINSAYITAVDSAKKCCEMCDSIQCYKQVVADLACGCFTYTNPSSSVTSLTNQWKSLGCDSVPWMCPSLVCPNVVGGNCAPGGKCQDILAP